MYYCVFNQKIVKKSFLDFAEKDFLIWNDLFESFDQEHQKSQNLFEYHLPSFEKINEIETSSRFYVENSAIYMTAALLENSQTDHPQLSNVMFILNGSCLVTIRKAALESFRLVESKILNCQIGHSVNGVDVFFDLIHTIIDRLADVLEDLEKQLENLSMSVFEKQNHSSLRISLTLIGKKAIRLSKINESLLSLLRLVMFAQQTLEKKDYFSKFHRFSKDLTSLQEYSSSLSQKIDLLLNTTLGLINIEQNHTIKILSVGALFFMPPTLVASIYGMNFKFMPELDWVYGYPLALIMMFLSSFFAIYYAKRKGWF